MKRKLFLIITMLFIGIFVSTKSEAILIGFDPISQNVPLGQQAIVNLFIKDLGDYQSPSLGAFDLYVYYNPAILSFSDYSLGPYLGDISSGEASDISLLESFPVHFPGAINFAEVSLLLPDDLNSLQPSQFNLVTITFNTLALGSSGLHLWYQPLMGLGDENGDPLDLYYEVYLQSGNLHVIPLPGTIIFVATGLAWISGVKLLRKNTSKKF